MAAVDDILNITQMANKIKQSIDEQLKDKLERLNEISESVQDIKASYEDAKKKGLSSQQERLKAKLDTKMKKLDKMEKSIDDWTNTQKKKVEDWISLQIDAIQTKQKELEKATAEAIQKNQEDRMKAKTNRLVAETTSNSTDI